MKKELLLLTLFSLTLFGCNKSSHTLWNKTFKSTGRVVLNYNEYVDSNHKISRINLLKDNFDHNIDWEHSGVIEEYTETPFTPFQASDYSSLDILKDNLKNWWQYYPNIKNMIDHTTTNVKKGEELTGTVNFHSDINPDEPTDNVFIATDISDEYDGSYLLLNKPNKDPVAEVYYTNYEDIVVIRNGPSNNVSKISFTFKLIEPVDDITSFNIINYIEIKEVKHNFPWWAIVLIVLGSLGLIYIVYLIIKRYRRYHHKY